MPKTGKPLLDVLHGQTARHPPLWLMRQAGRYLPEYRRIRATVQDFLELCFTPKLAVEVTLQPVERFAMDGAILFSDILVIPYALGQAVRFEEGRGPVLESIRDGAGIAALDRSKLHDRLSPVYETVSGVRDRLSGTTTLIGFAGAPWTVATYMVEGGTSRGYETIKGWAYGAPDEFQKLIDLLVDATADYLIEQVSHGAEALQIFDTWAGVLPEGAFERWSLRPIGEIVRRVGAAHPELPIIVFPRGAGVQYARFAEELPIAALGIDTAMPRGWVRDRIQSRCAIQGNLDPVMLLAGGESLDREVKTILEAFSRGPFIFNLGHGILPQTPMAHVDRLVDLVRGTER